MPESEGRRPLKVRGAKLPQRFAKWLSRKSVTPNQISIASVGFAALAGACFYYSPRTPSLPAFTLPVLGALFIQCRLLCNLFDGMVAVEGGKGTASGELFNDIPDRIADPLILVAFSYAASNPTLHSLGWFVGILSVMTAYVRTLCHSLGAPIDFRGPMAKQHRMATVTAAAIAWALERSFFKSEHSIGIALALISLGCLVTLWRRIRAAYLHLESR